MPRNIELDLEVLDAGVNHTLYASALVALAQAFNRGIDTNPPQQAVDRYAQRLNGALVRCGIDITIPRELGGADDILRFFQSNRLMLDISNLLVRQHSHRQELIFILSCVVGGVIAGSTGGVSDSTGAAQSQAMVVGRELNIPESVIAQCFNTERMTPLRDFLHSAEWCDPHP